MLERIAEAVIRGDHETVITLVTAALQSGIPAQEVLDKGLLGGMDVVGKRFREYEMFLPEIMQSAKAMHEGLELLKPEIISGEGRRQGRVVIGTVEGDIHDIGKSLVSAFMQGVGFEVVDLGTDVPPDRFVEAVRGEQPDILAMSSLLTSTMPAMERTIAALHSAALRDQVIVLVGGAPVTQSYAERIGADGYAADAVTGADKARKLLGQRVDA